MALASTDTRWGWFRTDKTTPGITWIPGTLEDSYERVARFGGRWILVSSVPLSAFRRVMAEVAEEVARDES